MMIRRAMHWPLTVILPNMMGRTNGGGPLVLTMGWINSPTLCHVGDGVRVRMPACTGATHLHRWNLASPMTPS
jgi:hypothetical protein